MKTRNLLRILHVSNSFYPSVKGGTEVFIHQLIEAQRHLPQPVDVLWAAHQSLLPTEYPGGCPPIEPQQRLLPPVKPGGRLASVGAEAAEIPGFKALLHEFRPDVVHLHSFSDACGLSHARAVKAFGARLVVTVHAPGFTCIKGNLIDASGAICDGVMRQRRCTRCRLQNGGLPRPLAAAVALQSGWPMNPEAPGTIAHVFTARQITAAFQASWRRLGGLADVIHVLAEWSRAVLLRNGVPEHKLHLIRTAGPPLLPPRRRRAMEDGVLRLVYWGRCHPVKGLHLVVNAILAMPASAPIHLDFYGPYWDSDYGRDLQARIADDPRFRLCGSLPKEQLLPRLQDYDLAVVPSTWLETGPLTVLEAFAAGLPVAGSDLGGIKELLEPVEGCYRVPLSVSAWVGLLQHLLVDTSALRPLEVKVASFTTLASSLRMLYSTVGSFEPEADET